VAGAEQTTIAIVGAGSIGTAFAVVFARGGFQVRLFDPEARQRDMARSVIEDRLQALRDYELLDEDHRTVLARVAVLPGLDACVADAVLVVECGPERLEIKREILAAIDAAAPPGAVIASASSAIPASQSADHLSGRARVLVAHPGNPPFLIPVVELVPAAFTNGGTIEQAERIFSAVGMEPVRLKREVEGFVFNRLQGALLREAYCLVRDGVADVEDIDVLVRQGLGLRWSIIGPFETADLNTQGGIEAHAARMGPAYARMGAERGQHDPWTPDLVARVTAARRARLPLDRWAERVVWRDRRLMALVRDRRVHKDIVE
jgi:L-gulonate 3-dehydrogenase